MFERLHNHASGRRSGDAFCIYICDRFVLKTLTQEDIVSITAGKLSLDDMIEQYIKERLSYRFVVVSDGQEARGIEKMIRQGKLGVGKPYLNPL